MNCGGITAPNELEFKYIVLGILTLRLSEDWCRGMGRRAPSPPRPACGGNRGGSAGDLAPLGERTRGRRSGGTGTGVWAEWGSLRTLVSLWSLRRYLRKGHLESDL